MEPDQPDNEKIEVEKIEVDEKKEESVDAEDIAEEIVATVIDDVIMSTSTQPSVAGVVLATIDDVIKTEEDEAPAPPEPETIPQPRPPSSKPTEAEKETQEMKLFVPEEEDETVEDKEVKTPSSPAGSKGMDSPSTTPIVNGHVSTGQVEEKTSAPDSPDVAQLDTPVPVGQKGRYEKGGERKVSDNIMRNPDGSSTAPRVSSHIVLTLLIF